MSDIYKKKIKIGDAVTIKFSVKHSDEDTPDIGDEYIFRAGEHFRNPENEFWETKMDFRNVGNGFQNNLSAEPNDW